LARPIQIKAYAIATIYADIQEGGIVIRADWRTVVLEGGPRRVDGYPDAVPVPTFERARCRLALLRSAAAMATLSRYP
jgi:hypothetical protein